MTIVLLRHSASRIVSHRLACSAYAPPSTSTTIRVLRTLSALQVFARLANVPRVHQALLVQPTLNAHRELVIHPNNVPRCLSLEIANPTVTVFPTNAVTVNAS